MQPRTVIHRAFREGTSGKIRCTEGGVGFRNGRWESDFVVTWQIYHPGEETVKRFPIDRVRFLPFPPPFLFFLSFFIVGVSRVSVFLLVLATSFLCFFLCLVYLGGSVLHCSTAAIVTAAILPITSLRFPSS